MPFFAIDHEADVVYSPDEGGWFWHHYYLGTDKTRVSQRLYPTRELAIAAYHRWKARQAKRPAQ